MRTWKWPIVNSERVDPAGRYICDILVGEAGRLRSRRNRHLAEAAVCCSLFVARARGISTPARRSCQKYIQRNHH